MDRIFIDLNSATGRHTEDSVHLTAFPGFRQDLIDSGLEERMEIAQKVSSMILGIRRKVNIKVRQPLARIMIPVTEKSFREKFEAVKELVLAEVNVKKAEYIDDTSSILVKKVKLDFKTLGPRYGKLMKEVSRIVSELTQKEIAALEKEGRLNLLINGQDTELSLNDVEIISEDIPGWQVANDGKLTVALDITVTDELRYEGIAREFVNRIQNIRKESGFDVTDKITVLIENHKLISEAIKRHSAYIGSQTLASKVEIVNGFTNNNVREIEIDDVQIRIAVVRNI
jgi:isoleucyl-tRNA synthetase